MKAKLAALLAGIILGGTGTGLAVTSGAIPRGHGTKFVGLPNVLCVNKQLGWAWPSAPKGTVAVWCTTASNSDPDYGVTFTWDKLSVYSPSGQLVYRARMVTPR